MLEFASLRGLGDAYVARGDAVYMYAYPDGLVWEMSWGWIALGSYATQWARLEF